jgi:uncharacterized protein (DUF2267 family)
MESPSRIFENDVYAPAMVDDLLKGLNDWRNIQDIVRLTFKALSDVVRTQGQAIRDIERQLPLKINRSEFSMALSSKANSNEIEEIQAILETKVGCLDNQILLEQKVSRSDVQYLLSNKPSIEEVKNLLENRVNIRDLESEINLIRNQIEDVYKDINRKVNQIPSERDLEYIYAQLKHKVSHDEFVQALELKASKQSVTAALQNKLDRFGLEEVLGKHSDSGDLQRILSILETKADYNLFEQLHSDLQNKLDRTDFNHIVLPEISKKAEKFEVELLIKDLKSTFDKNFLESSGTTEAYINSFKADLEQIRRSLNTSLSKKIDSKEIEKLYSALSKKADFEVTVELLEKIKYEFRDMANDIKRDLKRSEDFEFRYKLESDLSKLKEDFIINAEKNKEDSTETNIYIKSLTSGIKSEFQRDLNKLYEEIKYTQEALQDLVKTRVDHNEFLGAKQLLVENQRGIDKMRENLETNTQDLSEALKALKEDFVSKYKKIENEICENLNTKVSINDLPKLVENKLDASQAVKQLGVKNTQEDLAAVKKEIERIRIELSRKSSATDLESHIRSTELALEDVAKDMLIKCNIKDVCALLDMKANIDDTNKALSEVHKELDSKLNTDNFSSHLSDYNSIIEVLCSENCLGRWLWKSGEVKNGNLVPWEIQSVNTAPDNFLWEKDKISIVTVAPGLYEIILGFYSRKKPSIQILINGEPIMSAVNSSSYVVHHSSGKLKPVSAHPNGNIAGLTLIDFIALPARARVSVGYTGEINAEGFIGLRKL